MKILAIEKELPNATVEQFKQYAQAEATRAWELYQTGVFRELYFRQDENSAVLMLECETVEQAGQILNTLPLVKAGLIEFDLIPLRAYPGFARLFAEETIKDKTNEFNYPG